MVPTAFREPLVQEAKCLAAGSEQEWEGLDGAGPEPQTWAAPPGEGDFWDVLLMARRQSQFFTFLSSCSPHIKM